MSHAQQDGAADFVADLRIRFRLVHLLYAIAVLAAGMATFGGFGILPAIFVLASWTVVYGSSNRARALTLMSLTTLTCGLCAALLPAIPTAHSAARRAQCVSYLKQITMALHEYHQAFGTFPPAYIADENGRRLHSWRVLILPFIDEQVLYDQYKFDEPWDGPNNRMLLGFRPYAYGCPEQDRGSMRPSTETHYVAVVGEDTAWPGATGRRFSDFDGGLARTVLVMEDSTHSIPWLEPRDLDVDEALAALTEADPSKAGGHHRVDFFNEYVGGHNVAMADGSVDHIGTYVLRDQLQSLLTTDTSVDLEDLRFDPTRERVYARARLGNWFRLGVFIFLTLFPSPWALRKRSASARGDGSTE